MTTLNTDKHSIIADALKDQAELRLERKENARNMYDAMLLDADRQLIKEVEEAREHGLDFKTITKAIGMARQSYHEMKQKAGTSD